MLTSLRLTCLGRAGPGGLGRAGRARGTSEVARREERPCPIEVALGVRAPQPDGLERCRPTSGRAATAASYPSIAASSAVASSVAVAKPSGLSNAVRSVSGTVSPAAAAPVAIAARWSRTAFGVVEHRPSPGRTARRASHRGPGAAAATRRPRRRTSSYSVRASRRVVEQGQVGVARDPGPPQVVVCQAGPLLEQVEQAAPVGRSIDGLGFGSTADRRGRSLAGRDRLVRTDPGRGIGPDRAQAVRSGPLGDLAGEGERRRVGVVLGLVVLAPDRAPGVERDPCRLELGGQRRRRWP